MQISTNIPSLTSLRQPSSLKGGQDGQKLVFIYPVLSSSNLNKYVNLIRDFLSVELISQIKISNGLNITSRISHIGSVGIGDNSINPAVEVRRSLGMNIPELRNLNANNIELPNRNVADYELYKHQQKLDQFSRFFKQQLELNPIYKKYNPVITTVVADENYLVFPLIVGTKNLSMELKYLFYILTCSIILDLPLNNAGNLSRIISYLESLDLDKFLNILKIDGSQTSADRRNIAFTPRNGELNLYRNSKNVARDSPNSAHTSLFKLNSNELRIAVSAFRNVLDFSKWNAECDHLMNDSTSLSSESIPVIQTITQRRHFEGAMASFNSYVSEAIVPILLGLENILGPTPTEINYHAAVQNFTNSITRGMDRHYIETAEHIRVKLSEIPPQTDEDGNPIYSLNTNINSRFANAQFKIDDLKSFCKSNVELSNTVKKILYEDLAPKIKNIDMTNATSVSNFCDAVLKSSASLQPFANTIENWALAVVPDGENNLRAKFNEIKQLFQNALNEFFQGGRQYAIYDIYTPVNQFHLRYSNFCQVFGSYDPQNNIIPDPQEIRRLADTLYQIITQIKNALNDLLYFFFIWNFMSYICGYIDEVDIDIQIQKKDALEFPNYTLVLPLEIFKFLYTVYTSNRLKRYLKSDSFDPQQDRELAISTEKILSTFVPNADTKKMIELLNDRFKIPNLAIVDTYKNELWYQFMHMQKPNRVQLSSLPAYINSQKTIITSN